MNLEQARKYIEFLETKSRMMEDVDGDLMYAVYEIKGPWFAVCLDNPFIYKIASTKAEVRNAIKSKIQEFYGKTLEGIDIPDKLPEDF